MKKAMFKKVANSFAGRMLRRLMGEEKGSVMIEYILVALLIVVVGVGVFTMLGGVIGESGEAIGLAMGGGSDSEVETAVNNARDNAKGGAASSATRAKLVRGTAYSETATTNP